MKLKRISALCACACALVLFFSGLPARAAQETGSIQVVLEAVEGKSVSGVTLGLHKVADLEGGEYVVKEEFAHLDLDLNHISTALELETAARTLKAEMDQADFELVTDEEGRCGMSDLDLGLWLLYTLDPGQYEAITPLIAALPAWNEAAGTYDFDLEIWPKHERLPKIQVDKVDANTMQPIVSSQFEFSSFADADTKEKLRTVAGDVKTGAATFDLDFGTIYIKETAAPLGYKLSSEVVKVEVSPEGFFVNDRLIEDLEEDGIYHFVYVNSLLPVLSNVPTGLQTGQKFWLAVSGSALLAAGGAGFLLVKKKKAGQKA